MIAKAQTALAAFDRDEIDACATKDPRLRDVTWRMQGCPADRRNNHRCPTAKLLLPAAAP